MAQASPGPSAGLPDTSATGLACICTCPTTHIKVVKREFTVPAIEAILFAVAAGFAVTIIATILVIIGVHQEERNRTLANQHPPTIASILARRLLQTPANRSPGQQEEHTAEQNARSKHGHCR
jgi:hypothetical protein